jgi:hypothetical protein
MCLEDWTVSTLRNGIEGGKLAALVPMKALCAYSMSVLSWKKVGGREGGGSTLLHDRNMLLG